MKILVATEKPFAKEAIDGIRKEIEGAGHELVLLEKYSYPDDLIKAVATADALIVRSDKITPAIIDAAPQLKIIVRAGAGYDNIDLAAATARNIVVENTPGQNSNAVAELVMGLAVMAARNMYNGTTGTELRSKRLGLHAFGQVSRNVARIAKGFEMTLATLDPWCKAADVEAQGVEYVTDVEALYANNNYVSLHLPLTDDTRGSIGYRLISLLPKNGVLINTARKEVIDEEGLKQVLAERPDIKYVADVAPDCADELREKFAGQVFFTPKKMGAQTAEANINAGIAAARQIVDFFATGSEKFRVNKPAN